MNSDDEDNQSLIDEINALENVLDQKQFSRNNESTITDISKSVVPLKLEAEHENEYEEYDERFMEVDENSDEDNPYKNYTCEDLQDLLELNKKLIESISEAHDKMIVLLDECTNNQRVVEEQINKYTTNYTMKLISFNAGMPYFKDKNYFSPKKNEDTEKKIRNGELRLTELQRINRWNQGDKAFLLKAIKHEVTLNLLKTNESDDPLLDNIITKTSRLPSEVKKAIGSLGTMKFDWMKIANKMPENKHSAEECEVMWNVFLHPDINKQKWTSKEDKTLNCIVENFEFENWDAIAKQLNTKRSGYQCFVRYNTNNWKNLMKGQTWSPEDDRILLHLVSKLKIGDYIPWGYISSCMNSWTKQQVYFRWMYSLAPHLKKGKFSQEEDKQLLEAVDKYGQNFSKISAIVMTQRTNIQLKEHFKILLARSQQPKKIWTLEEDQKLTELYKIYGPNWAKIVREMSNISRVQARQRYNALSRLYKKGSDLQMKYQDNAEKEVPVIHTTLTYTTKSPWSRENKEIYVKYLKIDNQLIDFFKKESMIKKLERKSYMPEKLKQDTKRLYQILLKFNANLELPSYVDPSFDLDEKSQQLLVSLRDYTKGQNTNLDEKIEQVRLQMFGPQQQMSEKDRFIPPLPFGFCIPRSKGKPSNKIDYTPKRSDVHQIMPEMELESNPYVSECLGEDIEIQFEKFNKLLIKSCFEKPSKVYSIKCKSFASKDFFEATGRYHPYGQPQNIQLKFDWNTGTMVPYNSTSTKETVMVEGAPVRIVEPNRTTLQAYHELILMSSVFPSSSETSSNNYKLTSKGREALYLFKKRYEQLFHVSTGLSRIIPPDVVDESVFLPAVEKFKKKAIKHKKAKKQKNVNMDTSTA